jgi:hypothetical protein
MKNKILWLTRTAVLLALLVSVQAIMKPFGQIVTGSGVNLVLALSSLLAGWTSGLVVALISPILAFLLGIAPQILTVPAIMIGNAVFVTLLYWIADRAGKSLWRQVVAWLVSAVAKFAALYVLVSGLICGVLAERLLDAGILKKPMLQVLPATFSWPQLVTALFGGAIALIVFPLLKKALRK